MKAYVRTTLLGLLLIVGALLFLLARLLLNGTEGPVVIVIGVALALTLLATALAWRARRAGVIAAVVIVVLLVAANLPVLILELSVPGSVLDFGPNAAVLVGALLAIISGVAAVVHRNAEPGSTLDRERRLGVGALAVLGALLAVSAVITVTSRTSVEADEREGAQELRMQDFAYAPERSQAAPGTRLLLANDDSSWHTFTVDELDLDVRVLPGSEAIAEIPDSAEPGRYVFYCVPHSEERDGAREGMVGTLDIR